MRGILCTALILGALAESSTSIAAPLCDDPLTAEALGEALEAGRTHFFLMEGDQALAKLEEAEDRLSCVKDPLGADILVPFYQYLGAIYLAQEQLPEATRAMGNAAHLSQDLSWDPALENRAQALFLQVKAEQLQAGLHSLSAGEDPAFSGVRFNGVGIMPGQVIEGLSAGEYYAQRDFGDDGFWGGWVTLEGEGPWGLFLVTGGVAAEPLPEAQRGQPEVIHISPDYVAAPPRGGLAMTDDPYFPVVVAGAGAALVTGSIFTTLSRQYRAGVFDNTVPLYPSLKRTRATTGILTLGFLATATSVGVRIYQRSGDEEEVEVSLVPGGLGLRVEF